MKRTRKFKRVCFAASIAPDIEEFRGSATRAGGSATQATAARTRAGGGACGPALPRTVRLCIDKLQRPGPELTDPHVACEFLRRHAKGRDRESFFGVHLDARNRVIAVEEIARGHLTGVQVHPREVFKSAILSNAASILVAHNHTSSGWPEPSRQDIALTERLRDAAAVIGVQLVDHVIVGDEGCVSLKERGIL